MYYQYLAYNETGELVRGRLSAGSEEAVSDLLDFAGYQVISLKSFVPFLSKDKILSYFSSVKPADMILLYRQLALLLESGIDIITSFELLRTQSSNQTIKKVLGELTTDLRGGSPLSTAMDKHPKVFSVICRRSLRVGEQSGGLEVILRQIADYTEKEAAATKSLKGALTYPIITIIATIIVMFVMVGFVLPSFSGLYDSLGADLPAITRALLDFSEIIQSYGLYIMFGALIAVVSAYFYVKTPQGQYKWDKFMLRWPLLGRIVHLKELSRACRSISILYQAGLPLTDIMPLTIDSVTNKAIVEALNTVQQDMLRGEGLSQPMAKNSLFLPMMVQMVKVGEETGNLDATLLAVAQSYETEAKEKTTSVIGLIQPTLTLFIGGIIALLALSMVSAMYSIYGQAI